MSGPTPDINEFALAAYHAVRVRVLRGYAKNLRAGGTMHGWSLAECEKHARRHELAVRGCAFAAERSSTYDRASSLQRASYVRELLQRSGLPCTAELLP